MLPYQQQFIEFAIEKNVLRFGEFRLKSGRTSPYFFNSGLFNDGESLDRLGNFYAEAILSSQTEFDMLFGPAYKGIPLVSAMAIALHRNHRRSVPYCFNRKETKDHGEGGITLGAPLKDRVLIVDDVITAGTSIRHSIGLIEEANAYAAAVIVALDRQERGTGRKSAIQEIEQTYRLPVISIISLDALIEYMGNTQSLGLYLDKIHDYRDKFGTTAR